ncbi:DUF177 domain-containing protein [Hyphobacterium sp. CCMP332]|nr:DUF177 domain-containing protein [Hyphobacterium sp. CCMP332]
MRLDIEKVMKRKDYWVDIINLKNGTYEYDFNIQDKFFDFFDNSIVERGKLEVKLSLEKSERLIRVIFRIDGTVELICDRSLKKFNHPLKVQHEHLYKYSEYEENDTEDITHISANTESIDMGQLVYEYIVLNIPMKKIHPDHKNDKEEGFFYKTEIKEDKNKKGDIDPRWEALKKLK